MNMLQFIKGLFDYNEKELRRLRRLVVEINKREEAVKKLSDKKLAAKTDEFRGRLRQGIPIQQLIPDAFAVVREAARRTVGMRHYDVQLMAAIALFEGKVAEQKTGEGKTLSATPALYLRALEGKGAHLVTVNDYLARRDAGWMAPIFHFLGLSVGCIIPQKSFLYDPQYRGQSEDERLRHLKPVDRHQAYQADITYGTNNEFGFDYLRDNMAQSLGEMVQRQHHFAIVDEVDFALIDEARTPLIISSPAGGSTEKYRHFAQVADQLTLETDYILDEKARTAMLTEYGMKRVERILGVKNLYEDDFETVHYIENALKAKALFQRDRDYVIKNGQVIIVDEFTGRLMPGRRWSDGLHQAIEAKEGVTVQQESKTWATITFQNYFRMYPVLAGMTGTAATEAEEFKKIYDLDVIVIPTNKPMIRRNEPDLVFKNQRAKYAAIAAEVEKCYRRGQPVLIGTTSIEKNEIVGNLLKKKGIPHQILNAKNHEKEAGIIAQAGKLKAVTVATNMAGRGVDIILGGAIPKTKEAQQKWQKEHAKVLGLGGLRVIGTERHEARRIDNQLRGRAGRQGDPGSSLFFVALDDDLMRVFGGEKIASMMGRFKMPENVPISHRMVSRVIEQIQVKVEGFNFDIRKSLVEFDDVVNRQREVIYRQRYNYLLWAEKDQKKLLEEVENLLKEESKALLSEAEDKDNQVDKQRLVMLITEIVGNSARKGPAQLGALQTSDQLFQFLKQMWEKKKEELGADALELVKGLLFYTLDQLWIDHLTALDSLREGVRLRGYGQRDPLVEYRRESYRMFQQLLARFRNRFLRRVFHLQSFRSQAAVPNLNGHQGLLNIEELARAAFAVPPSGDSTNNAEVAKSAMPAVKEVRSHPKIGRNDPCWCGSGKKWKNCHYPEPPPEGWHG